MTHLGIFVALCSIRRWVSWIFLGWSFAGHGDQHGCAYVLSGWRSLGDTESAC